MRYFAEHCRIPLYQFRYTVTTATARPAAVLDLGTERGSLRVGARAYLVVLGEGRRTETVYLVGNRMA